MSAPEDRKPPVQVCVGNRWQIRAASTVQKQQPQQIAALHEAREHTCSNRSVRPIHELTQTLANLGITNTTTASCADLAQCKLAHLPNRIFPLLYRPSTDSRARGSSSWELKPVTCSSHLQFLTALATDKLSKVCFEQFQGDDVHPQVQGVRLYVSTSW